MPLDISVAPSQGGPGNMTYSYQSSRQMLGPIELDANGEASGDGWEFARIEHDMRYFSLRIDDSGSENPWFYTAGDARTVERLVNNTLETEAGPYFNPRQLRDLQAWARKVGWPGYEAEPQHLTCGPLRLEREWDDYKWRSRDASLFVYAPCEDMTRATAVLRLGDNWDLGARVEGDTTTEAAQALAAAIEASTDPAVVRFRAEHWDTRPLTPEMMMAAMDAPGITGPRFGPGPLLPPEFFDLTTAALSGKLPRWLELEEAGTRILTDAAIPCQGPVHAQLHGALARQGWFPLEAERQIAAACEEFFRFEWFIRSHRTGRDRAGNTASTDGLTFDIYLDGKRMTRGRVKP